MAVTAGVVNRALKTARIAAVQVSAQLFGAADLYGPHHFLLSGRQPMCLLKALPVAAKDIGQLGACLFLSCRQLGLASGMATPGLKRGVAQIEQVQGTGGGAELGLANLQIALGTLKRVMTQQRLDGHQVHSAL